MPTACWMARCWRRIRAASDRGADVACRAGFAGLFYLLRPLLRAPAVPMCHTVARACPVFEGILTAVCAALVLNFYFFCMFFTWFLPFFCCVFSCIFFGN